MAFEVLGIVKLLLPASDKVVVLLDLPLPPSHCEDVAGEEPTVLP